MLATYEQLILRSKLLREPRLLKSVCVERKLRNQSKVHGRTTRPRTCPEHASVEYRDRPSDQQNLLTCCLETRRTARPSAAKAGIAWYTVVLCCGGCASVPRASDLLPICISSSFMLSTISSFVSYFMGACSFKSFRQTALVGLLEIHRLTEMSAEQYVRMHISCYVFSFGVVPLFAPGLACPCFDDAPCWLRC